MKPCGSCVRAPTSSCSADACGRLQAIARRVDRVRPNVVSTSELYEAGLGRMVRVARTEYEKRDVQALQYGDGLLMAMQACKAMRRRNIVGTRIGANLLRVGDVYVLQFAPCETKNGKPIRAELPRSLTPFIDEWLSTYRPTLLRDRISDAMWISGYRQPMAASTVTARFKCGCKRRVGCAHEPSPCAPLPRDRRRFGTAPTSAYAALPP